MGSCKVLAMANVDEELMANGNINAALQLEMRNEKAERVVSSYLINMWNDKMQWNK